MGEHVRVEIPITPDGPDGPDVLDGGDVVEGVGVDGLASGSSSARVVGWFLGEGGDENLAIYMKK